MLTATLSYFYIFHKVGIDCYLLEVCMASLPHLPYHIPLHYALLQPGDFALFACFYSQCCGAGCGGNLVNKEWIANGFCQTSGSTLYCWRPSMRMIPHLPRSNMCSTSSSIREEKPLTTATSSLRAICAAHSRVGNTDSVEIWLDARNANLCFCNKVALPICCCVFGINLLLLF